MSYLLFTPPTEDLLTPDTVDDPRPEGPVDDAAAMDEALRLAAAAGRLGNVPVGAVVVVDGRIVARASNLRHVLQDPTAHAEVLALRSAAQATGSWRLDGATLVVTVEPCAMCAGALRQARVARLVYGAAEPRTGAVDSAHHLLAGAPIEVTGGLDAETSAALMSTFFEARRRT